MRITFALLAGLIVSIGLMGCDNTTSSSKTVNTVKTPGGETKTTVEQKVEKTDDSTTRTTTEKVEKSGEAPPATRP